MKSSRKIIAGLLVAAGLAATGAIAYAHPEGFGRGWGGCAYGGAGPGTMGYGPMGPGMMAGSGPAAHLDARLAYLKTELKLAPNQESAWQAYAQQARQQAESMQALPAQPAAAAQSAPELLNQRAEFAKQRAADMESMSVAVKNLYAALTPEQKTIADRYFGGTRVNQAGPRGYWR